MAYYAFINEHNIVTEVISGKDEDTGDWESYYGAQRGQTCLRTSYNGNIRKQFAGVGYTYDPDADVFIAPQPFPSWTLDANYDWQPPTPQPSPQYENSVTYWNEESSTWIEVVK